MHMFQSVVSVAIFQESSKMGKSGKKKKKYIIHFQINQSKFFVPMSFIEKFKQSLTDNVGISIVRIKRLIRHSIS